MADVCMTMSDHVLIIFLAAGRGLGVSEWRSAEAQLKTEKKHAGSEVAEASRKGFGILVGFGLTWVVKLSVVRWAAEVRRSAHDRLHAGSAESLDVTTLEMCSCKAARCASSHTCASRCGLCGEFATVHAIRGL